MRVFAVTALLAAAIVTTGADAKSPKRDPEAELAKMIGTRTAGPPEHCLPLMRGNSSTTIEGVGIVYQVGSKLYVNRFRGNCPMLTWDRIIVTQTTTGQICRGDIARIVSRTPVIDVGSCIFGDFTPYSRAK